MKKIDFTKLPVGTPVFYQPAGWGKIAGLRTSPQYPIWVDFGHDQGSFMYDGRFTVSGNICLFLNEYQVPDSANEPPVPDLKKNDKIMVRDSGDSEWVRAYFCSFNPALPYPVKTFSGGGDSWASYGNTVVWAQWRLPTPEELED